MKVRSGVKYIITKWYRERPWGLCPEPLPIICLSRWPGSEGHRQRSRYGRTDLVSVIVDAIAVLLLEFPIFASGDVARLKLHLGIDASQLDALTRYEVQGQARPFLEDRKSTRLNSSH